MRISDWSSDVCSSDLLKLNLGGRYSWDKVNACGGGFWTDYVDRETCDEQAALGLTDGVGIVRNKGEEPSWTIGLDYKLNDEVLLYIVSRRGYRGAIVNTPAFESAFTTRGTRCNTPSGACPDLRLFTKQGDKKLSKLEACANNAFPLEN